MNDLVSKGNGPIENHQAKDKVMIGMTNIVQNRQMNLRKIDQNQLCQDDKVRDKSLIFRTCFGITDF